MEHVYFYKQKYEMMVSHQHLNITVNILCGCHCSVALQNFVDLYVSFTESWLDPLISFCLFVSLFTVDDFVITVFCLCGKLTHVLRAIKSVI